MPPDGTLRLRVNGEERELSCDPLEPLAVALRRELRLYGVRETCGVGVCGTCTVLLDDRPVSSCLLPTFAAVGRELVTVEGLETDGELSRVQQAFVQEQGFQCSFCTPGFVLATEALLKEETDVDDDAIEQYLSGHLCRCGSYDFICNAVKAAASGSGAKRDEDPRSLRGTD
jgi:aerobic-type carbon monoxide dehydrogenase small subunit (CoxS/CutS family)